MSGEESPPKDEVGMLYQLVCLPLSTGTFTYENLGNGATGLSLALFTRHLGWRPEEVEVFCIDVRKAMLNRAIHGWWPM